MALDDPQTTAAFVAAAEEAGEFEIKEDWTGTLPTDFLVRTIDLKEVQVASGGQVVTELHAMFRDLAPAQQLPPEGITQAIKNVVRGGAPAPNFFFATQPASYLQTPLDIELLGGAPLYIVLILGKPFNMRFSPGKKGVTHKEDDREFYGGLRHVKVTATTYEESEDWLDDCAIVYFIANPPAPPSLPPPEEYNYRHPFNLNVRLRQPDGSDQKPRALDLVIDPDIRYPGQ
ncbi:MAG TPA: nucleotide synthetase [Allosphingosinicella sp.]|nr:nucleotide synthetase [Allosphingosinicella sp.]